MRERPILFSAAMVRPILADTKTHTRRILKPQPTVEARGLLGHPKLGGHFAPHVFGYCAAKMIPCPYGAPGDRLWVREGHSIECEACNAGLAVLGGCVCRTRAAVRYRADVDNPGRGWRPSIHMPRWASRITLDVIGVRVERLHDIDELGALAEGVEGQSVESVLDGKRGEYIVGSARDAFVALWCEINGSESWDANPWVWVIEFKRAQLAEAA